MIIGLTGYAQSGKDSVADILVKNYGYTRIAFADPIRKLLYEMNPIVKDGGYRVQPVVDSYGWDVAKTAFPEIRTMLQSLGVGARKTFGDMFWVKQALNELQLFGEVNYVITDVRYPNEANKLNTAAIIKITPAAVLIIFPLKNSYLLKFPYKYGPK